MPEWFSIQDLQAHRSTAPRESQVGLVAGGADTIWAAMVVVICIAAGLLITLAPIPLRWSASSVAPATPVFGQHG
jgi:hypothetical protein